jgi:excisionase family DNA binding protein
VTARSVPPVSTSGAVPMLIVADGRVAAHMAVAITTYVDNARRKYRAVPPELRPIAQALAASAMASQAGTTIDHPAAVAHAERVEPQLLSIAQVAAALHVSTRTVRRMIAEGALTAVHVGQLVRIRVTDLDDYLTHLR